jgi:hypothetical protein
MREAHNSVPCTQWCTLGIILYTVASHAIALVGALCHVWRARARAMDKHWVHYNVR